jgi:hypothetical protein
VLKNFTDIRELLFCRRNALRIWRQIHGSRFFFDTIGNSLFAGYVTRNATHRFAEVFYKTNLMPLPATPTIKRSHDGVRYQVIGANTLTKTAELSAKHLRRSTNPTPIDIGNSRIGGLHLFD